MDVTSSLVSRRSVRRETTSLFASAIFNVELELCLAIGLAKRGLMKSLRMCKRLLLEGPSQKIQKIHKTSTKEGGRIKRLLNRKYEETWSATEVLFHHPHTCSH
jgi:hypothetical protein